MSIAEFKELCKRTLGECASEEVFLVALILLVGVGGFGIGRLSLIGENKAPVTITQSAAIAGAAETSVSDTAHADGGFVASKSGTKYHLPWCAGASTIKEENKIWFASKEAAEAAGYAPAGNCKGL